MPGLQSVIQSMKFLKIVFKFVAFLVLVGGLAAVGGGWWLYHELAPTLPDTESLKDVRMQVPLRVYSRDGLLLAEFGEKRRIPLHFREIPKRLRQAFIAAEDDRFYQHPGVDYQGLLRAAFQYALTGKRRQGGSTITMQVARNFFLTREKTFTRKLKEIFLALRIEHELTKQEILELYLNKIYLGQRAYGVGAAAQIYYGVPVAQLTLPQMAMLAGLPKAPSTTNPITDAQRARARRDYVLGRMRELGFISGEEYRRAMAAPLTARLHITAMDLDAPYMGEMVRVEMLRRYGEAAYSRGLVVHVTLDGHLQEAADHALRKALLAYDRRHGWRGPAGHRPLQAATPQSVRLGWVLELPAVPELERGLVVGVEDRAVEVLDEDGESRRIEWPGIRWARRSLPKRRVGPRPRKAAEVVSVGDLVYLYLERDAPKRKKGKKRTPPSPPYWRLAQPPEVEGALVSLNPDDGAILALSGGYAFSRSKFNRVVQAHRQPGSGFKPFIYSAALAKGYTPASLINDNPIVLRDASLEGDWRPENYSGKVFGPTRLRVALYKSRNLVSIRLLRAIGVDYALDYVKRFGFDPARLPHNLTLALGSGEVTPLELSGAYAVLANGGFRVKPYFIERVEDVRDGVLEEAHPLRVCPECADAAVAAGAERQVVVQDAAPRVMDPRVHYLITSMMKDVIRRGTGHRAMVLGRHDLAGKTGTTNEQRDAWFNGFNRRVLANVWVGFDSFQPLGRGEVGGRAALPAWVDYMRVALEGMPETSWPMPEGMVTVRIDPKTGLRATAGSRQGVFEVFRKENVPAQGPGPSPDGEGSVPGEGGQDPAADLF